MNRDERAVIMHRMLCENPEYTIKDYLDVVEGHTTLPEPKYVEVDRPQRAKVIKQAAPSAPVRVEITEPRNMIKTVAEAKKAGFSCGLKPGGIYGTEKMKYHFRMGDNNLMLQATFRASYKEGREYLREVINENS